VFQNIKNSAIEGIPSTSMSVSVRDWADLIYHRKSGQANVLAIRDTARLLQTI
jgi:hypothetical protein